MTSAKVRDQATIKQHNIQSVLKTLRDEQPVSRKELTALTQMSPTSITRIVGALLDYQLISEGETPGATGRGRRAIQLTTNPAGLYTLGFLLDRKSIRMCVHNFDDELLYSANRDIPKGAPTTAEALAQEALALFHTLPEGILRAPENLQGIGVTVPGIVNHLDGVVENSIRLDWRGVALARAFENAFGLPTWVENDVKAALVGEKDRLGIPRRNDTAYIYLGATGIATAVTSDGALLRGERNAAGEVAHIVLSPSDLPCSCGQHGCLQLHLVESCLVQRAQRIDPGIRSAEDILTAHYQHLTWADMLINDFKRHLSLVIALLDSFCNPGRIIVSGNVVAKLLSTLDDIWDESHITFTEDFEGAAVRGAAIIAMQQSLARRLGDHD